MKRYVIPAALAALVTGAVAALAVVAPVNPQLCNNPQSCVDFNAQYLPLLNSSALLSPANLGITTIANIGTTCTTAQKGQEWLVTDAAATPVYNATAAGSGTVIIPVVCNGTNWTNH